MKPSKIGIISHPRIDSCLVSEVADCLKEAGLRLFFDPVSAKKVGRKKTEVNKMLVDVAFVFGGDGTILWVVSRICGNPLILGVNTGKVGYLAEITPNEVKKKIKNIIDGRFWVDERTKLLVDNKFSVLNEVLVISKDPATLLDFRVSLDGVEVAHFRADGVMVSTPTGSTGYSLSAGGPILHPSVSAYIITPLNPFLRAQMPLVVPDDSVTEIELLREDREASLILDGQSAGVIKPTKSVVVCKSNEKVRFIRFSADFKQKQLNVWRNG